MPDAATFQGKIDPGHPAFNARTAPGQHVESLVLGIDGQALTTTVVVDRGDAGRPGDLAEVDDHQIVMQR